MTRPSAAAGFLLGALMTISACTPRLQEAGTQRQDPSLTEDMFIASDGYRHPVRQWAPALLNDKTQNSTPRAIVMALHGFNDYSRAFEDIAGFLAGHGVHVYAYDQRGFGNTDERGVWPGTGPLIEDARCFYRLLKARHKDVPILIVGESMGGAVAIAATTGPGAIQNAPLVLIAPALWGRETMNVFLRGALWLSAHTVPGLYLSGQGLDIQASDNIDALRALSRDPLVIKTPRVDAVYGIVNLMDLAYASMSGLSHPTLLLYGGKDQVIPRGPTLMALEQLPPEAPVRIAVYKNGFHMLTRDLAAKTAFQDVLSWINDPAAKLPSGADKDGLDRLGRLTE